MLDCGLVCRQAQVALSRSQSPLHANIGCGESCWHVKCILWHIALNSYPGSADAHPEVLSSKGGSARDMICHQPVNIDAWLTNYPFKAELG